MTNDAEAGMGSDLFAKRKARFSPCRLYRYTLLIEWDRDGPMLNFLMLNPSTADEVANDPTVERCERRARMTGFGSLVVTNVFALRSTDPQALYGHPDPIGPDNDVSIARAAAFSDLVICGWGTHVERVMPGRTEKVLGLIRGAGKTPHALKINAGGSPQHPLYVGYGVEPIVFG